jgi:hypothetical protein
MTQAVRDARSRRMPDDGRGARIRPAQPAPTASGGARKVLRAGVVGIGKQALDDHIPGLQACDSAELVAICDEDPEVVREQRYQLRVPGYADFREMLAEQDLDLVIVTVPHYAGRQVIEAAAGHHVHVLKEKPFATSADEARELAGICEQAGIQLMVTLQRRFNPIYTSFLQLADHRPTTGPSGHRSQSGRSWRCERRAWPLSHAAASPARYGHAAVRERRCQAAPSSPVPPPFDLRPERVQAASDNPDLFGQA